MDNQDKLRIDKWLWAARFYKTRSLASEAVKGGKIHVNDARVKASHALQVGQVVRIRKSSLEMTVEVLQLSDKRGSAPQAQLLYQETEQSISQRELKHEQYRQAMQGQVLSEKRPNKKQRREIIRFKQEN